MRKAKVEKVPYFIVIGDEEAGSMSVTIEGRDGKQEKLKLEDAIHKFQNYR